MNNINLMTTAPTVSVIPATKCSVQNGIKLKQQKNIRVAAYCRVSTGDESQQTSYTKQKEHYTALIRSRESWRFAGIYADQAMSGTSRLHRIEFNRMIDDAMAGKLDYIVTKSISRFARNTVDTLNCVRQLQQKNPPVGVYFEKENIDTLEATGELFLTILSALAQEESRSISDNIRWTFQKNFQAGKPQINLNRMIGYDKGENGEWVINKEQAEIVKYIFQRFLCGESGRGIARELNEQGKKTVNGNNWRADTIFGVLRNEKFVGDLEMQKTITKNFLTHESIVNTGEAPRYYVRDHHPAIIDRITWNKTQAMLLEWGCKSNQLSMALESKSDMISYAVPKRRGPLRSPFSNLICGTENRGQMCGEKLVRMTYSGYEMGCGEELKNRKYKEENKIKHRFVYPVWKCRHKLKKNTDCECRSIVLNEYVMQQSFMEMLYAIKRDYEELSDKSEIVTKFKENNIASNIGDDEGMIAEKHNFKFFLSCLKKLPWKNQAGMVLNISGLDICDASSNDINDLPDYLDFEKSIYMAFIQNGVIYGDEVEYITNFGVTLISTGNSRTLKNLIGFRRGKADGTVEILDSLMKIHNKRRLF